MHRFDDDVAPARLLCEAEQARAERRLRAATATARELATLADDALAAAVATESAAAAVEVGGSDLAQAQLAAAHRCLLLRHAAAQRSAAERMRADAVVADHRAIAERQALAALRDRCEALARAERQQRRSRDRAAAAADDAERDDLFLLRWRRAS